MSSYDYQARGREFSVNDYVHPIGSGPMSIGRVSEVYPGIGMVQVEFPNGSRRFPVEDVEKIVPSQSLVLPTQTENVPGGSENLPSVSAGRPPKSMADGGLTTDAPGKESGVGATVGPDGGASPASKTALTLDQMVDRVMEAHVKKALYWHSADRNYRVNKAEYESGQYTCPKCKESTLKKAIYKMRNGQRHRLFICPGCTFVVKQDNIHTDHCCPQEKVAVDFKSVAKKLLDKSKGTTQDDLHYRMYLRAIMQGQPSGHLVKKFKGAEKARQDLIDEAGKAPPRGM